MTLSAARLTVAYSDAGGIQIDRLTASGGVLLRSPSETARGEYAIYDLNNRVITMLGGVTLTRGESRVNVARLVLSLDTGRAVLDGGSGAVPGRTSIEDGRVFGTFTVPQRPEQDLDLKRITESTKLLTVRCVNRFFFLFYILSI